MARIDSFLRLVVDQRASDLHVHAGEVPTVRYAGELRPLAFRPLSEEEAFRFIREIMMPDQFEEFERDQQVDFAYVVPGAGRFRAHTFMQARGPSAVFRYIPESPPSLDELGLPAQIRGLTQEANGLVLVTGPTGCGKTTTLAAIIHEINKGSQRHIITIEDPIEFIHEPIHSAVTQRQVGTHAESFASALRSALRESPDVIVLGEVRDPETIGLALSAAETGALVFATLHSKSAAKAIDCILDACSEETREQARSVLSILLKGVIAQQLCALANGDGVIVAVELLLQSYAVSHMIRDNKVFQIDSHLDSVAQQGEGQTLDSCLIRYVTEGLITMEEAIRSANSPEAVRRAAPQSPGAV